MRRRLAPLIMAAIAVPLAVAGPASATEAAPCTPYQLPGLPGGTGQGEVVWINDAGTYVGGATDADGTMHAVWWTHTGTDLATGWSIHRVPVGPDNTEVLDTNRFGVMTIADSDTGQSFVYDTSRDTVTRLPDLPGGAWTWPRRINAAGEVAGGAQAKDGVGYATVWFPPYTSAKKLPDAGAGQSVGTRDSAHDKMFSEADGLNDAGTAAGVTSLGGPVQDLSFAARNGFWRGAVAPLLTPIEWQANGQPGRLQPGAHGGAASAINNAGTAVGWADRSDYTPAPAYWQNGQEHDMGAPSDITFGQAYGISQGGWAVGVYIRTDAVNRGFVWTGSGALQALEPLPGYRDSLTHAASDRLGQVGGFSSPDAAGPDTYPTVWQCPPGFSTG